MRENEANPSAATAIPVNSNTLGPGSAPGTSGSTGGRSGTATATPATPAASTAAAPAAPAAEGRRKARPHPFSRGLYGVLLKLIDAARHLSPRDRIRLLTGVLLVAALIAILAVGDHIPERVIVLYAFVSATLVMLVGKEKDGGIRQAALILTFALMFLVAQHADRLFEARTVTNPVAGRPQRHLVSGKVVDPRGGRPLADVSVRARGDGESTQTDSLGRFRLGVLESSIQGGVVEFQLVQGSRVVVVSHPVSDGEITLEFGDRVAQAEPGETTRAPGGPAAVPLLLVGRPADTGERRNGVLAVIVDSIHTLNDGTGLSRSEWSFDVKVTDATPIHVSRAVYSERAPDRLMLVGSETDVPAGAGDTIRITVNGVREVFFWKYRVKGSVPVAYAAVPADRPLRREVRVQGDQVWDGQFLFFLTVLRLPGRPG